MKIKSILLIGLFTSTIFILGVTFAFPVLDDLMVLNPGWNGLSELYTILKPTRVEELSALTVLIDDPHNSTLLVLGPSKSFNDDELSVLKKYVSSGGLIVLADDFGSSNELLIELDVGIRNSGLLLQDQLYKEKNSLMPKIYNISETYPGIKYLVTNYPSTLITSKSVTVLSWSSPFSYVSDTPTIPRYAIESGPFPIIAESTYHEGKIIVASDSSLFINGMIERGDNTALLLNLIQGQVYIDESHSIPSRLSEMKTILVNIYAVLRMTEIRYGLTFLTVFIIFKVKWNKEDEDEVIDEVEEVLKRHPEYDRELLQKLQQLRRNTRGH